MKQGRKRKNGSAPKSGLRRLAEEKAAALGSRVTAPPSLQETQRLVHELQVHQIELELQNEELHRSQIELDAIRARYFELFDLAPVGYITVSEPGLILETNLTAMNLLGVTRGELIRQALTRFICKEDQDIYFLHRKQLMTTGAPQTCYLRMKKKDQSLFWAHLQINTSSASTGALLHRLVISDITERKQVEEELQKTLTEVKILRGILPICSSCKQIRNGQGHWIPVEVFIRDHSDAQFSHGMCPECRKRLYPEYESDQLPEGKKTP